MSSYITIFLHDYTFLGRREGFKEGYFVYQGFGQAYFSFGFWLEPVSSNDLANPKTMFIVIVFNSDL